jgi:hypothetical protein
MSISKEKKKEYNKSYREKEKLRKEKEDIKEKSIEINEEKKEVEMTQEEKKEVIITQEEPKVHKDSNFFLNLIKKSGNVMKDRVIDKASTLIMMTILTTVLKIGSAYMSPSEIPKLEQPITSTKVELKEPQQDSKNSEELEICYLPPVRGTLFY